MTRQETRAAIRSAASLPATAPRESSLAPSSLLLIGVLVVVTVLRPVLSPLLGGESVLAWTTIFTAMFVQAAPFLVLGVAISAAVSAFVPASFFARALPRHQALSVPVAGAAGVVLPGCECGSVPIAAGLVRKGVPLASALAFMLSAPAINPIVLVTTAVAFPNNPQMVLGRFVASLGVAVMVGYLWSWRGNPSWLRPVTPRADSPGNRLRAFVDTATHDFIHTGGFLVIGAAAAATVQVVVPRSVLSAVSGDLLTSVLVLALFAVILAICSEADAFVAASLTQFSLTARLAFLVVGPMVDLKLIALQSSTFGWRFAVRFASATFVLGVGVSLLVGWWLL